MPGPMTSRRRLRDALRQFRCDTGFSADEVRRQMDWSHSKLTRIESGIVSIDLGDLRVLLEFYGVTDEARIESLCELSRASWKRSHWVAPYRDYISPTYADYLGYEDDAQRVSQYHPTVIPGLVQTEAYARALITAVTVGRSCTSEEMEALRRVRSVRQGHLLFGLPWKGELRVAIDEVALSRPVGGDAVMREQRDYLQEVSQHRHVRIVVVPPSVGAHPGLAGPFNVLEFNSAEDPDLVYLDNAPNGVGVLAEDVGRVTGFKFVFDQLFAAGAPVAG